MFDKLNQAGNQPVVPSFGLTGTNFGQGNNAPGFGQGTASFGQNAPLFGQNTSMFGAPSNTASLGGFSGNPQATSLFGNGNQNQQNQQSNFLSSFNPNAGGFPPVASGQDTDNLMKPRK
jgi:hypothetical protein